MLPDTGPGQPLISVQDLVHGIQMHALVSQPAIADAETPLVFVHGLGVSVRYLEPTMARLARGHHLAGVDLPGFGRSGSPPHTLDVQELCDALVSWLDVRAIAPAVFIGNSFGCQVIVDLVSRYPDRVVGLVLNAPTMDPAHRSMPGQLIRLLADIPFEPWRLAPLVARDFLRAGPRRLLDTLRFALEDRIEDKLPMILAPTVIVCGAHDPVVSVEWAAEATRLVGVSVRSTPGASLHVVPTAAHALPYEDPTTFAALIDAFVERVRASRQPR